jgi:hypothetical protein
MDLLLFMSIFAPSYVYFGVVQVHPSLMHIFLLLFLSCKLFDNGNKI